MSAEEWTAWDDFVLRHRARGNLVIHFFSFILYIASWILLFALWDWRWILGLFASGALGSSGHWIFSDGGVKVREATWDPLVPFFVAIMFWKLARGEYFLEIERVEARLREIEAQRR